MRPSLAILARRAGHVAGVVLFVSLGGCILFVPDFEPQAHCAIEGETACAACIRASCQPAIDTCCASKSCSEPTAFGVTIPGILGSVDECGSGDRTLCHASLLGARTATDEEAVRSCVATSCAAECFDGDARPSGSSGPAWSCATPRDAQGTCASCIYASCADGIDECCDDATCSANQGIKKDIAACVAGDEPGCAWLLSKSTSGLEGVVRVCIAKECGTKCMADGRPHASCTLHAGGAYCVCSDAEESRGQECSAAKVGGHCIIGSRGCTCGKYACDSNRTGCSCTFGAGGGGTSCQVPATSGTPGTCCLDLRDSDVTCECDEYKSCHPDLGEYEVSSCDEEAILDVLEGAGRVTTKCSR